MPRRSYAIALGTIVAVWMLVFAPQLFAGRTFVLGDAREFRTFSEFSRARWIANHTRTFWNPYVFAGIPAVPSLADSRPQYLPDALIDLYERVRMPTACPLAALLLAQLAGMLATAALAARLWGARAAGMTAAGLVWGLAPILLGPFTFGHDARLVSASLMAVLLLATHGTLASQGRRAPLGWALGVALVLGLQVLTGHPQVVIYSGTLAVLFALVEARSRRRLARLASLAGGFALGAAVGAAVWIPAMRYSAHSSRGGGGEVGVQLTQVASYSLSLRDWLAFVWPRALGQGDTYWGGLHWNDFPQYMGLVAVLIVLLTWRGARRLGPAHARLFTSVIVVAALVALGTSLGPLYGFLHAHVPLWSKFRVPVATLLAGQLALALLVGRGLAAPPAPPSRRTVLVLGVAAALALTVGVALWSGPLATPYASLARGLRPTLPVERATSGGREAGRELVRAVLLAGIAVVALRLASRETWRARSRMVVALASVLDLAVVTVPLLARANGRPADLAAPEPRPLVQLAAADHASRAFPSRSLVGGGSPLERRRVLEFESNFWIPWRARSLGGNHGAVPGVWRPIAERELTRWYAVACAFGVVYIAADSGMTLDPALYTPLPGTGTPPVHRLRDALGRAYAVELVAAPGDDRAVVDAMASRDFVPNVIAFASDADRRVVGEYPGSPRCTLRWMRDDPDGLTLEARAPERAFVVIADTWFPGWNARLDGVPVDIHRVNQALRGIVVPAGVHTLTMDYVPEGWRAGVALTRGAMLTWIALAAMLALASHRRGRNVKSAARVMRAASA